ncbi:relaxase/mobilization nuclease domain-containing protein [Afipia clevelandensis]|uniref:MobA/VirD2-like nuclease domain-containing protein n=1 Tax=Afipia clevelandensis ATCC 49720 TaxID=883079 RepID=K8NYG3_9BRAD|nr:relaxase/mobilization nuclease domain-containing protein [Afipia clevelandensis]EKS35362.1 hypothetical protein HMPREF9696_02634 [Afipia clevelandensis ATCC 49720]
MILKGSQRGGPRQLAAHLLNDKDNDHVTVQDIRGFVAGDLAGAMAETVAIAKGTRARQPVFSLSLNPPKDAESSVTQLMEAVERAEEALGLQGQPRAIVIHEKNGRRHAHVVWSRVDAESMKAINLPHFKNRLKALSKELYLEHGWQLPDGHKENGWKNPLNFTLADWQQAKRLGLDPREIKQVFREAWARSDNLASFKNALEERGYYLARGDRRVIVATDVTGQVYSVARWSGLKTKDVRQKLGDGERLPSVSVTQADLHHRVSDRLRDHLHNDKADQKAALQVLKDDLRKVVMKQRVERARLQSAQSIRRDNEVKDRASRFRRGLGVVIDVLSGRYFKLRKQNESEAYASFVRDRTQRERLYEDQRQERAPFQQRIENLQEAQKVHRAGLAQQIASVLRVARRTDPGRADRNRDYELELGI